SGRHTAREADMRFETDQTGGVDHPHDDRLLIRREARKVGFAPDGRKGLPVDDGAVGFKRVGHQRAPTSARTSDALSPRLAGTSRGEPLRTRSKPSRVPTSVISEALGSAQPLAQPET